MKAKIKRLWIKALESGKYKQTTGLLKDGNSFCCLGVLCDIHRKTQKKKGWSVDDCYYGDGGSLPFHVAKWAGLNDTDPNIGKYQATELNDYLKLSFKQIAKRIKKYL